MNLHIKKSTLLSVLFIIILFVSMVDTINGIRLPLIKQYFAGLFIIFTYYTGIRGEGIPVSDKKKIKHIIKIYLIPYLLLCLWSYFLFIFNENSIGYFTRATANTIYQCIAIITAACAFYIFGKRALNLCWLSSVFCYLFNIISGISICGFSSVKYYYLDITESTAIGQYLEQHELIFIFGLFTIYYFMITKHEDAHKTIKLIISLIFVAIGFKRILFAALALLFFIVIILRRMMIKNRINQFLIVIDIATISMVIGSIGWIYLLKSGLISEYATIYNIDFMGRLRMYNYFAPFYDVSGTFLGLGVGATEKIMAASGVFKGNSVHSDIFRNYLEYGCIPFVIWVVYFINYIPRKLKYNHQMKISIVFFVLLIYMFIISLTDNVCRYYHFQMVIFMMIIRFYLDQSSILTQYLDDGR